MGEEMLRVVRGTAKLVHELCDELERMGRELKAVRDDRDKLAGELHLVKLTGREPAPIAKPARRRSRR